MDKTKVFILSLVIAISVGAVCLFSSNWKIESKYSRMDAAAFQQGEGVKKTLPVDPDNDKRATNLPVYRFEA